MPDLNKEIVNAIKELDSDKEIKDFLEEILNYELDQTDNDEKDSAKASGAKYKKFIAKHAK